MRVVLDTNVILSAAFFPGVCDKLLSHCLMAPGVELVLSEPILREFVEHGTGKLGGSPDWVDAFVKVLRRRATSVEPVPIPSSVFGDPDDLPVLGSAVAANAQYLVTGDKGLLALNTYQEVIILSPRSFYDRLRS